MESSVFDSSSTLTPEKLAIMKLNSSLDRDVFSEPASPTLGSRRINFDSQTEVNGGNERSLATRATRHVSNSSRRTSSFMSSHRNKMSMELTTQAESKFFSLMDFMSNASREASSLKEYWSRLMSERESFAREKEELLVQIDDITESLERTQSQHHHHGRELSDRKKEVERLLIELSTALTGVSEQKKKVAERDQELDRVRSELQDLKLTSTRSHADHDKFRLDFDGLEGRLKIAEGERDHAREDADKHRGVIRTLTREHSDLKARNGDIAARLESSRKEVSTLTDRIRTFDREREEYLVEKDRLQEDLRKANTKAEESSRELLDLTERYDRLQRETHKTKETIHVIESERNEHAVTIDRLRHDLKNKTANFEDSEAKYADTLLKYEKAKRDITTHTDRLREVEHEVTDVRRYLENKNEEHRLIVIERDQYKDDLEDERRNIHDRDQTIAGMREALSKAEAALGEVRLEVTALNDRITAVTRERDDAAAKHHPYTMEITELKDKIAILQAELRTTTDARDHARKELQDFKQKYAEMTETITEWQSGSGELEFEIESLRTMLREAREQKERAISARTAADRERDEYVAKYEEKCREMERWEENRASWYREHSHSHGSGLLGRSTSTRTVTTRSGTMAEEHGHGHSERADGE